VAVLLRWGRIDEASAERPPSGACIGDRVSGVVRGAGRAVQAGRRTLRDTIGKAELAGNSVAKFEITRNAVGRSEGSAKGELRVGSATASDDDRGAQRFCFGA